MLMTPTRVAVKPIVYPERDGKPMADNTRQFRWIQTLHGNIAALCRNRDDVFVAGDLLCYPKEGHPEISMAPDVLVVFGRPRGDRGSYKQWQEGGIPLTVVFEVLSPSNTWSEMVDKLLCYEEHGVEEYYVYDPDHNHLTVYRRQGELLKRVLPVHGDVSPRLGIRFDLSGAEMIVFGPDGRRFLTFEELQAEREHLQQQMTRLTGLQQQMTRLAELSRKVLRGQASAEERAELEGLVGENPP